VNGEALLCPRCGAAVPEGREDCASCGATLVLPQTLEGPTASAEMTPQARRLRLCELALVVGVGFLWPTVLALYHWWIDATPSAPTALTNLGRIFDSILAISVLAYVLYRRGGSLRTIGLVFHRTDILWALVILVLDRLMVLAVFRDISGFAAPKSYPVGYVGLLRWLTVIPSAATEELIVRAFLMTEVAGLTGSWGIAVVASVGFQSLYHLYQGTPAALLTAGTFFVSAVYYANTRRITPVILAHSLHNFLYLTGN
jgi:membrane protease YdiL (CAAX protease family)